MIHRNYILCSFNPLFEYAGYAWGIPDQEVWNEATFESKPGLYRKIPCTQINITVKNKRNPLPKAADDRIESQEQYQQRVKEYMEKTPHIYEYMIG